LNTAIAEFCRRLNDERVIRRVGQTRRQLLETVERQALKPLPANPYVFAEWRIRRVGIDYHVEVENHFYSVPHRFARAEVEARFTTRTVEVFLRGERIATHRRGSGDGKHTTVAEHMPSSHRRYADWTIERIRREADAIGPSVGVLCALILERRPHPEQGFRACLGILRLLRSVSAGRLDGAATRAIEIGALTYGSVKSILDNKLDRQSTDRLRSEHTPVRHRNIRGGGYFH
jgi:transposase